MARKTPNDTQRAIIAAAAARQDFRVLPIPTTISADDAILQQMLDSGLLDEVLATPEDVAWRQDDEAGKLTLVVTPHGLQAIGIEPAGETPVGPAAAAASPTAGAKRAKAGSKPAGGGTSRGKGEAAPRATKGGKNRPAAAGAEKPASKQDNVIALLRRQQGASVAEMVQATGWQPHSVRGFMSAALKKRLGMEVISEKDASGERRYHVSPLKPAAA